MPGFFDPVAATFVLSILQNYGGYTLFELPGPQTVLVSTAAITARTTIAGDTGLAKRPRAILVNMTVTLQATGVLSALRQGTILVYETGAGPAHSTVQVELVTGDPAGHFIRQSAIAIVRLNAAGQFDWEGQGALEASELFEIRRLAAIY